MIVSERRGSAATEVLAASPEGARSSRGTEAPAALSRERRRREPLVRSAAGAKRRWREAVARSATESAGAKGQVRSAAGPKGQRRAKRSRGDR